MEGVRLARRSASALVALGIAFALLAACQAQASTMTEISSFSDPRGALPNRPGTLKKGLYGPFTIPAAASPSQPGQLHNVPTSEPAPCSSNCRITDMIPSLVYADGTPANMNNSVMLHHFVLFNPTRQGIGCPINEPIFGAGNERTHLNLPTPYGYENTAPNWTMITHLVNLAPTAQTVYVQMIYRHRPLSETQPTRPLWLDIDSICNGGDSEYTIDPGYSDTHVNWSSPVTGRIIDMYGHLHDVDIIDPNPCIVHCPARGGGIALSAELQGGSGGTYFGPVPPTSTPPADITGATLCRSEASYGTSYGTSQGTNGHLDTMSHCGIFTDLAPTAQTKAYPAGGGYPFDGVPIKAGQVIRLHSEYQNGSGIQKTDVMGIMSAWIALPDPGYPRPRGATPLRASLVPAYRQCTAPNRQHGGPLNVGSCNPPAQESGYLTVGTMDANGSTPSFVGSVRMDVVTGNANTVADEADVRYRVSMTDVRKKSDLSDYTGQVRVASTVRITDRYNGPSEVGTASDLVLPLTVPCTGTGDTAVGSTCAVTTTQDAVTPNSVLEERRSNWQMGQINVYDGGPDGVASTQDNTLFAVQGLFVP
jgi:hypothetical protein